MPKSLADGHLKLTLCTTKPANPAAPTATELLAGIDISCAVLASDFQFTAADSDKFNENALCEDTNVNSLGRSNYTAGMTLFKYFDASTKNSSVTEDVALAAVKNKGTVVYLYARNTAKKSADAWVAADEIYLGAKVMSDALQEPSDMGGYIKRRVPLEVQEAYPNVLVAAA